jgi:hypothetical protein
MKLPLHSVLLMVGITAILTFAQNPIPNAGFESWNGNVPSGWTASTNIPGFEPITKSTDAYSGNFAARGEVISIGGFPGPPVLYTGTPQEQTFPCTQSFQTFTGQYKFAAQGGDMLFIEIAFINVNIGGGAEAHAQIGIDATSYTEVEIQMEYDPNNPAGWVPTHGNISVTIQPQSGQTPHIGTYFLIDHFSFDGNPLGLDRTAEEQIPASFTLEQNYPNPFNPSTNIKFSVPEESFVTLKVFNIQGEEVATLVNGSLPVGNYKADWAASNVSSGVYFYVLRSNNVYLSRKMILLR